MVHFASFRITPAHEAPSTPPADETAGGGLLSSNLHAAVGHGHPSRQLYRAKRANGPHLSARRARRRRQLYRRSGGDHHPRHRSEEHTSELQSLMRISYAVFCLKKQKDKSD